MRWLTATLCLLLIAGGIVSADDNKKLSIAVSYGMFRPSSGSTRDIFGSTWSGIGIGQFTRQRAARWRPTFDVALYNHDDVGRATLVPVTIGVQRAFGSTGSAIPYAAVRVGPYYGRVRDALGERSTHIGFDANAAMGVTINERVFVEARYDYFSRIAGTSFDGVSLTVGVRVFDFGK
jgi:hypothetical protein